MGMNKRYIDINITNSALYTYQLSKLYGKCDILLFEDDGSSHIYNLFKSGKSESEIINLLKTESHEMY
jgi:hypothetical protein